jgi:hypothetical protein
MKGENVQIRMIVNHTINQLGVQGSQDEVLMFSNIAIWQG